jgi:hypothetical protein
MSNIDENAVGKAIGGNFALKTYSNGNIQATIQDLKSTGPYDVCKQLIAAADKLVEAGIVTDPNACVRLSWNTQKKDENGQDVWKPYPQLWVNQPSKTQVAIDGNVSRVDSLESTVANLATAVQAMLQAQTPAASTPEASAPAPALPAETDHPF